MTRQRDEIPSDIVSREPVPASEESGPTLTLRSVFRQYRWKVIATYVLFNLENLLRLAQPLVIGLAIDDLLRPEPRYSGVILFVIQHLAHLALGTVRLMYDTRCFTSIYSDLATRLIVEQRQTGVEVSRVSARSVLSREFVQFFEQHVPLMIRASYSVVGGLAMLGYYDWRLIPICLLLMLPAMVLNRFYARKTFLLSNNLHDDLENEVQVIESGEEVRVRGHYDSVGSWRVKLSDAEAINFGLMEFFVLGMLLAALILFCQPGTAAGDVFAVFRYLMMFLMGMDSLPKLVHQLSRLKDIGQRMKPGEFAGRGKKFGM